MIELRWAVMMVDRPRGIDDGFHMPPLPDKLESRTLQYRCLIQTASYNNPVTQEHVTERRWTEWQDAPTVWLDAAHGEDHKEKP